jgi:hypothetical protein
MRDYCISAVSAAFGRRNFPGTPASVMVTILWIPSRGGVEKQRSQQKPAIILSIDQISCFRLVSYSLSMASSSESSSSNFQLIINNALKAYEKRTKRDLLAHPLTAQLYSCNSPDAILAILQQQVIGLDQLRSSDDRWTKWLRPTVSVLYAVSATLGEGVGLVSLRI